MKLSNVISLLQRYSTHLLLSFSLLANIGLAVTLQHERNVYTARFNYKASQVGQTLGSFVAQDVNGKQLDVSLRSELPTIVYVFGVHCKYCERNLENVNALARAVKNRYRFLGVSVAAKKEEFAAYRKSHNLAYDAVNVDEATAMKLKFDITPKTYALSNSGKVLEVWKGAWGLANRTGIEKHFGVNLPEALNTTASTSRTPGR